MKRGKKEGAERSLEEQALGSGWVQAKLSKDIRKVCDSVGSGPFL
jgi:hypothetical protein